MTNSKKIYSVIKEKTSYGHWKVTLDLGEEKICSITTDSKAVDDDDDLILAKEVCRKNEVDENGRMIDYDYSVIERQQEDKEQYLY